MKSDEPWLAIAPALLAGALLGCGSVVTTPNDTMSTDASTTGTGGAGGSCIDACPDCTAFAPWSLAISEPGLKTELVGWNDLSVAPNGTVVLSTTGWTPDYPSTMVGDHVTKIDPAGNVVWQIGDGHASIPLSDGACGTFVVGTIGHETTSAFGMPVTCAASSCLCIAHLDPSGAPAWFHVHDPGAAHFPLAQLAAGNRLFLAGELHGALDLGSVHMESATGKAAAVVALSSDGSGLWGRVIAAPGPQPTSTWWYGPPTGLDASPAGDVVIAGNFALEIDFGNGPISKPAGPTDNGTYLAAFDPSGNLRFGDVFSNPDGPGGWSVAFDASGDIVMAGAVIGAMDLGGGPVGEDGQIQLVVARFDPTGHHVWSHALPGTLAAPFGLVVDGAGHILVGADGAVLELDTSGSLVKTHALGGSGYRPVHSIRFGPGGSSIVAGTFDDTVDLGQGLLTAGAERAVFVGVLSL